MRRWLFRLAYNRYKKMTFEDDIARLNELITLFKRTDWFQTIYHPRAGRRYALKLWYINAQSLRDDLVAWQDSLDVEDPEYITMEDYTYALLETPTALSLAYGHEWSGSLLYRSDGRCCYLRTRFSNMVRRPES